MTLPQGFLFTQSNLQDCVECQRRFQLRYLLHLDWPAVEAEPYQEHELLVKQGSQFHKIVRQHLSGIPEPEIERTIENDETMHQYWRNYLQSRKQGILSGIFTEPGRHYEEITVSTPLQSFRLIARYDVLVIQPDEKLVILDWKTSQNRPKRKWLGDRLQTRVYPFVLARHIAGITDHLQIDPNRIEMLYWFANFPDQPERFQYNDLLYSAYKQYLDDLVLALSQKSDAVFPLTLDERHCLFCTYRSLCDRGVKPGELHQMEQWRAAEPASEDAIIDFEQVIEIEF